MKPGSLSEIIRTRAAELGFEKAGIAPATETQDEKSNLSEWLARGYHGSMAWMERRRDERGDIRTYFPEARSVISVGMNYFTGTSSGIVASGSEEFHFSNYAWGDDYHGILKEKLKNLAQVIQEHVPNARCLVCVDTSPVMEKAWARRAGIGWQGKHTNLITRDYGSWLFLGELIVDVELEYDEPFSADLCGSCTACIDACPTGALDPYILNSEKCISYLTIEYRGDLQDREDLNGWVYGCDICQEVCPWNIKFQQLSSEVAFQSRKTIKKWTLREWIEKIPGTFNRLFKGSAVKRTGAARFLRNFHAVNGKDN